jgi:hypothetical protein
MSVSTNPCRQSVSPSSPSEHRRGLPDAVHVRGPHARSAPQAPKSYTCHEATSWCNGSFGMYRFHFVRSPDHPSPPIIRTFVADVLRTASTSDCMPAA